MDPTLRLRKRDMQALARKRVTTKEYSRRRLFRQIARGRIGLYCGLAVTVSGGRGEEYARRRLVQGIRTGFPKTETARIQTGPLDPWRYLKVPEVIRRWEEGHTILSVTDLHFRGTDFENLIDISALSNFNILCTDPQFTTEFIERLEMMTLVISTRGNVTDSHSDDCDGSNHCFTGSKLWITWDRVEGQGKGLQDNTRDLVDGRAAFDMRTFLSLPSARWFVISANQTLFLPGNLAHKVVTLDDYLGVGSFHVTLPGSLGTLARWHVHGTTDVHRKGLLNKITQAVIRRLRALDGKSQKHKNDWGLPDLQTAVRVWKKRESRRHKGLLLSKPGFAAFIEAVLALEP